MSMRLARNAGWSVAAVVVSGLSLFLIYKLIVAWLGVEAVGIWSLVLATTSLARFADVGASEGLSRFVTLAEARGDRREAVEYIETAMLSNAVLYIVLALVLVYPARSGIAYVIPPEALASAQELLPYALVSLVLMNITSVLNASLVGLHRTDQKSIIVILGVGVQVLGILVFVRSYGLVGLAWAQIAQYVFIMVVAWLVLQRNLSRDTRLRLAIHWKKKIFKDLIGFGMRLRAAALLNVSFDVIVKFLMSSMAGLEMLGLYEMASRMAFQVRQLVMAPSQILTPAFAQVDAQTPDRLSPFYEKVTATTFVVATPLMLAAILVSPLVSLFWLGHISSYFLGFLAIVASSWLVNAFCVPGHHLGISRGIVGWNIAGHAIATFGGGILAAVLGSIFGGIGIVAGAYAMLTLGVMLSAFMNCRRAGIQTLPSRQSLRAAIGDMLARARKSVGFVFRSRAG